MNADETALDHLTERIISSALANSNALGAGFLLVQEPVIVELMAIKAIAEIHRAQCINDLRARACKSARCATSATRV